VPVPVPVRRPGQAIPVPPPYIPAPQLNNNVNNIMPDETFEHLFHSCPTVKPIIKSFFEKHTGWDHTNLESTKNFIFTGRAPNISETNLFISSVSIIFNFYIWQCKLQKKLPTPAALENELFYSLENILRTSNTIRNDMQLNLPLCRNWQDEAGRRR
jgi:hypothetical protein